MEKDLSAENVIGKTNLLGQVLLKRGLITQEQIDEALVIQKNKGGMLGDILIGLGFVKPEALSMAVASQSDTVYLPLARYKVSKELLSLVPIEVASKYMCFPLETVADVLVIAMVNPSNKDAVSEIERLTRYKVVSVISTRSEIQAAMKENYGV